MSSVLSDQQMAVVHAGSDRRVSWMPVALPTGRQDIPRWCLGLNVNWHFGCGNAPSYTLKVTGDAHTWPEPWRKEGEKRYISRSSDGRAHVHYHDGAVSMVGAWRNVLTPTERKHIGHDAQWCYEVPRGGGVATPYPYGPPSVAETPEEAARRGAAEWLKEATHLCEKERAKRKHEFQTVRATARQEGYGGAAITIRMEDGEDLVLRGPWHGGAPAGYVEVSTCDWDTYGNAAILGGTSPYKWLGRRECVKPWHQRGSSYGLYITEELFLLLVARFAPHTLALRVTHSYGARLELADASWGGVPKIVVYEEERMRAQRNEPAGRFWRMYWDGRGGYCGSLRMPTYGWEPDVTDRVTPEYVKSVKPRW